MNKIVVSLGILLLLYGLVAPCFGFPLGWSLATYVLDTVAPTINSPYAYPVGSQSSPTSLAQNTAITLKLYFSDNQMTYASWKAKVIVTYGSTNTGDLYLAPSVTGGIYDGFFFLTWTTPNQAGITLTFSFTAYDYVSNTATYTSYGMIGAPTGTFYLNGQAVTSSSTIYGKDKAVTFKISVTNLASQVTDATVTVSLGTNTITLSKSGGQLAQSGADYTASYTLAWGDGSYTIIPKIWTGGKYTDSGAISYTLCIVNFPLSTGIWTLPNITIPELSAFVNVFTVLGGLLMVAGALIGKK